MKKIIIFISVFTLISCNKEIQTEFVETPISNNYNIKLPSDFEEKREGMWKFPENTYLFITIKEGIGESLEEEVDTEAEIYDDKESYKGKVFVKTESFDKNGFKGLVKFYERVIKSKSTGIISIKTYIVFGVIQDDKNRIYINSISLDRNINEDLLTSIKSISSSKIKIAENNFDEEKAISDGYQIFKDDNFIIKCQGKILFDKLRFEDPQSKYSKPYHVFNKGVDYNINVSDMSSVLNGKNGNEIASYNKDDLTYYQTKFDEMGIKYERKTFKGFDAVFYESPQEGKLAKAVYFHNNLKSYMLQVTSKNEHNKIFDEFIESFDLIEK